MGRAAGQVLTNIEFFYANTGARMKIVGKNIYLRLAAMDDAEFIANLRLDSKNKFLTKVDVDDQREWLAEYKERETAGSEYYFVICTKDNDPCGTVRVYDFVENSFCWGSWLLNSSAPKSAGIESALLVYEFAFYHLGFSHCHFDVRLENTKVRSFHERLGASVIKSDDLDAYFSLPLAQYEAIKPKYGRYLPDCVRYELS
jgi:RimJ/RimL family protein N-acetyltransferase